MLTSNSNGRIYLGTQEVHALEVSPGDDNSRAKLHSISEGVLVKTMMLKLGVGLRGT